MKCYRVTENLMSPLGTKYRQRNNKFYFQLTKLFKTGKLCFRFSQYGETSVTKIRTNFVRVETMFSLTDLNDFDGLKAMEYSIFEYELNPAR